MRRKGCTNSCCWRPITHCDCCRWKQFRREWHPGDWRKSTARGRVIVNALPRLPIVKAQSLFAPVCDVAVNGAIMRPGVDNNATARRNILHGVVFDRDIVRIVVNVNPVDDIAGDGAVVAARQGADNIVANGVVVRRIVATPGVNTAAIVHIHHRIFHLIALDNNARAVKTNPHVADIGNGIVANDATRVSINQPNPAGIKTTRKTGAVLPIGHTGIRDAVVRKRAVCHIGKYGALVITIGDGVVLEEVVVSTDKQRLKIVFKHAILDGIVVRRTHQPDALLRVVLKFEVLEKVIRPIIVATNPQQIHRCLDVAVVGVGAAHKIQGLSIGVVKPFALGIQQFEFIVEIEISVRTCGGHCRGPLHGVPRLRSDDLPVKLPVVLPHADIGSHKIIPRTAHCRAGQTIGGSRTQVPGTRVRGSRQGLYCAVGVQKMNRFGDRGFPNITVVHRPVGNRLRAFKNRQRASAVSVKRNAIVVVRGKSNGSPERIAPAEIHPVAVADGSPGARHPTQLGAQVREGTPGRGGRGAVVGVVTGVGKVIINGPRGAVHE